MPPRMAQNKRPPEGGQLREWIARVPVTGDITCDRPAAYLVPISAVSERVHQVMQAANDPPDRAERANTMMTVVVNRRTAAPAGGVATIPATLVPAAMAARALSVAPSLSVAPAWAGVRLAWRQRCAGDADDDSGKCRNNKLPDSHKFLHSRGCL